MVDSISNNNLNEVQTTGLSQSQLIERLNRESALQKSGLDSLFGDSSNISDQARILAAREQEAAPFASIAQRQEEEFNSDKVAYFRDLLDSGRINDYLRGVNNDDLANALLNSPAASLLQ